MTDEHPIERPPTSEEEMRAATVGELVVHGTTIHLADYDPEWPRLFEREAARIRSILGDRVRRLEHVGSTSVPGLAAKPIIDIVLAVPDSADEPAYVPDMEAAGYVLRIREPDWFEHRLFKGPDTNVNLHTYSDGCAEIDRLPRVPRLAAQRTTTSATCTSGRSATSPPASGGTSSTTPMRRPRSSKGSSRGRRPAAPYHDGLTDPTDARGPRCSVRTCGSS